MLTPAFNRGAASCSFRHNRRRATTKLLKGSAAAPKGIRSAKIGSAKIRAAKIRAARRIT